MLPNSPKNDQPNLFNTYLSDILDSRDPLVVLSDTIEWDYFNKELERFYSDKGRPAKPIRLMVGLLLLKQLKSLSDEELMMQWKQNPYYQYFCGSETFQVSEPCHATDLVYFRQRIGKKGVEKIFQMSVQLHGKDAQEKRVIIDTTVQEKNITYPTDGKLVIKMIHHLHKVAKREGIQMRRAYVRELKEHRLSLRFFKHPKKRKKAKTAIKRLRTIVGILMRNISRELTPERLSQYQETFELFEKVRNQQIKDTNKTYSLHEQHVYVISKGKDHKQYEYGTKASIVTAYKSGVIVGVAAHDTNEHDSKTLDAALTSANANRDKPVLEAVCDRGYRGRKEVLRTTILIPGTVLKRDSEYQKEKKRKMFRRRAAIEPIIGHLKSDHRLSRNYLKGFVGDEINLLMAASAFNLKKWMNNYIQLLFALVLALLFTLVWQEKMQTSELFLLIWKYTQ